MRVALELVPILGGGGICPTVAYFKKSQGVQAMAFPSNHICQKWGFPNNFLATN